ncbi:hypothetical protein [Bdellovibrio bacteriovorus]|uniref:hypothetical protein n=1 Tax=Bdellovibrio bacteriovorus TaxID=959 RepID=UPI003AA7D00B
MKSLISSLVVILGCQTAIAQEAAKPTPPETAPVAASAETTEKPEKKETEFTRPLFFSVVDQELKIKNPVVEYDLKKSKGKQLDIGGLVFDSQSLAAKVENNTLNLTWNHELVPGGEVSVISQQGKELWKQPVKGTGTWSSAAINESKGPQWKDGERFRFCLRAEAGKGYSSICSQWYGVEIKDGNVQIGVTKSEASPRVIFQNEEKKLQGAEEVAVGTPVQFLATLDSDATYEFVSEPVAPVIRDMIESEKKAGDVTLTGDMPRPLKLESENIVGEDYGAVTKMLGFESTIGARADMWQADVNQKNARLVLPGKSGGVFVYNLEITEPPRQKDRRFISTRALKGTYLSKDQMPVRDMEDNVTVWNFEAPQKFAMNTATLDVPGEKATHKSYLEIYRAGAGEASLRLTGVVTSDSDYVVLGEGHVSWWFNDLFGWQNYWLSKQRWGVSAKYFTSLTNLPASTAGGNSEDVKLAVMDADLRYRFTPGLWEKDETLGLIVAYEAMTLGDSNVPKIGAGLFWARSMPRAIDYWFSKIPFMNYPKWVDMEFIKYFSSTDSDITLGDDYVLNFHGKVLWTPRFFGEAGFGLKNYYYEKNSDGSGAKLTTFYGTVGLGVNF